MHWYSVYTVKAIAKNQISDLIKELDGIAEVYVPHKVISGEHEQYIEYLTPGMVYVKCSDPNRIEQKVRKVFRYSKFLRDIDGVAQEVDEFILNIQSKANYVTNRSKYNVNEEIIINEGIFIGQRGLVVNTDNDFAYVIVFLKNGNIRIPIRNS